MCKLSLAAVTMCVSKLILVEGIKCVSKLWFLTTSVTLLRFGGTHLSPSTGGQGVEAGDLEHYWSQIEFEATLEYIF